MRVHAEKIVTALSRGTVSTRWRDFADIYLLSRHHPITGNDPVASVREVANHRHVEPAPLARILDGYGESASSDGLRSAASSVSMTGYQM